MWHEIRATLRLGWPIILGNISQVALGLLDSAMVGYIHSSQLAAASFVNNLITIPLIIGIGLTTAIAPLVATAEGRKDQNSPLQILFNGLLVVGIAIFVLVLGIQLFPGLISGMGQDPVVEKLAGPYLRWMAWGMLPMAGFMALKQFSDAIGQTRWPMFLSFAAIPLNFGLNYVLIYGWGIIPRLELAGAGIATLVTRLIIMVALAVVIATRASFAPYRRNWQRSLRWQRQHLRDILRIGVPAGLQYGMEAGAFSVSGILVGQLGYIPLAAHQIALGLASFTFMISLGISSAGSIRVAYAYGQNNRQQARAIGLTTLLLAGVYGLVCGAIFIGGRQYLPLLFNHEGPVVQLAALLLILAALFQISDSVQAVGVGLLRGLHDVKIPTVFVAIAYWVIGIPVGYALAFWWQWDAVGIWCGLIVGLSVSALLLSLRFLRLAR